jgi:hypothetical protein
MSKKTEDVDISELAAYEEDEEETQDKNDKKDDGKKCVNMVL